MPTDHDPLDLAERARRAFERTITDQPPTAPPDPATLARLQQAVAALRRRDREVFLAHRIDHLSYADIAARTGLSDASIRRCMARAMYEIMRFMADDPVQRWRIWPFR